MGGRACLRMKILIMIADCFLSLWQQSLLAPPHRRRLPPHPISITPTDYHHHHPHTPTPYSSNNNHHHNPTPVAHDGNQAKKKDPQACVMLMTLILQ